MILEQDSSRSENRRTTIRPRLASRIEGVLSLDTTNLSNFGSTQSQPWHYAPQNRAVGEEADCEGTPIRFPFGFRLRSEPEKNHKLNELLRCWLILTDHAFLLN